LDTELSITLPQFPYQTLSRRSKSTTQFQHIERAYKRIGKGINHRSREPITASGRASILTESKTSESKDVIADPSDEVFGLPELVALNARSGMKHVEPAHSEKIRCIGLRRRLQLVSGTEERTKLRTACTQVLRCHHHHVDLQTTGQKKHPREPPWASMQIKLLDHANFLIEQLCPVIKNIRFLTSAHLHG
jgi:hypothetical protein